MEPRIVLKPEILLIGMPYYGDPSDGAFAKTWERFVVLEDAIPNRANSNEYYGLESYTTEFEKEHKWFYQVGVEVTSLVMYQSYWSLSDYQLLNMPSSP